MYKVVYAILFAWVSIEYAVRQSADTNYIMSDWQALYTLTIFLTLNFCILFDK